MLEEKGDRAAPPGLLGGHAKYQYAIKVSRDAAPGTKIEVTSEPCFQAPGPPSGGPQPAEPAAAREGACGGEARNLPEWAFSFRGTVAG